MNKLPVSQYPLLAGSSSEIDSLDDECVLQHCGLQAISGFLYRKCGFTGNYEM